MRTLMMILLMVGSAMADTDPRKIAATRLTVTYQCAEVTGDVAPYESAKTAARNALGSEADAIIAVVEKQPTGNPSLTAQLCRDLIAGFR